MAIKNPHPGQLRHMIEIGRTVGGQDADGYPLPAPDTVLGSVWAAIEDNSSRYYYGAGAEIAERGIAFVIRWRSDVVPGMWVKWNGIKYAIEKIGEYDFKRRYLRIETTASKGVS